ILSGDAAPEAENVGDDGQSGSTGSKWRSADMELLVLQPAAVLPELDNPVDLKPSGDRGGPKKQKTKKKRSCDDRLKLKLDVRDRKQKCSDDSRDRLVAVGTRSFDDSTGSGLVAENLSLSKLGFVLTKLRKEGKRKKKRLKEKKPNSKIHTNRAAASTTGISNMTYLVIFDRGAFLTAPFPALGRSSSRKKLQLSAISCLSGLGGTIPRASLTLSRALAHLGTPADFSFLGAHSSPAVD
ncbi:hypothetical protein LOZ66_004570, partial [Ophidiomyces ophidiicola]